MVMGDEEHYLEYVAQITLSILAVSSGFLFDYSLETAPALILIPVLFGFTAYVSRESFRFSSLLSLFTLVFIALDSLAPIAIVVAFGNFLVSFFASGESFKDYYGAVMVPMLITGLILGGSVYLGAQTDPTIKEDTRSGVSNLVSSQTATIINETGIKETQRKANEQAVRQTSKATLALTQQHFLNSSEFTDQEKTRIYNSLLEAQQEIPEKLVESTQNRTKAVDATERASSSVENLLSDKNLVFIVPAIAMVFYTLHPIIGILTAIFGSMFGYFLREEE